MILIRLLLAIVLAAAFGIVVLGLEVGLLLAIGELFDTRFSPRGIGWIIVPFVSGIAGWKFGWNYEVPLALAYLAKDWFFRTRNGRAALLGLLVWIAGWTAYCWFNDDFGNYYGWEEEDWFAYLGGLVGLPILVLFGWLGLRWVNKGEAQ